MTKDCPKGIDRSKNCYFFNSWVSVEDSLIQTKLQALIISHVIKSISYSRQVSSNDLKVMVDDPKGNSGNSNTNQ